MSLNPCVLLILSLLAGNSRLHCTHPLEMPARVKHTVLHSFQVHFSDLVSIFFFPADREERSGPCISESLLINPHAAQLSSHFSYCILPPLTTTPGPTWPSLQCGRSPSGPAWASPHSTLFQWQMLCLSPASQQQQQRKSVACSPATGAPSIIRPVMVASPSALSTSLTLWLWYLQEPPPQLTHLPPTHPPKHTLALTHPSLSLIYCVMEIWVVLHIISLNEKQMCNVVQWWWVSWWLDSRQDSHGTVHSSDWLLLSMAAQITASGSPDKYKSVCCVYCYTSRWIDSVCMQRLCGHYEMLTKGSKCVCKVKRVSISCYYWSYY